MAKLERRQLTAILFADIVGYTALMQSNEKQALANLQKFKIELEKSVPTNSGTIIQYYGDACLATFNSAADAASCALALQIAFQDQPKVPVRIGLHSGEVVFKEGNVFGDAVNIASRIESMGVPGAILLSSSVRNQIKNKEEFALTSLGKFEFKNIEDAMTVYALTNDNLVVPKKDNLKGKFKTAKATATAPTNRYPLVIGGLLLALVASLVYIGLKPTASQAMTTKEVSIVNEAGEAETRMVPTAEFTRKFVSFPFEVALDEKDADWLSIALPILFNNDMEQDMRLSGISPIHLKGEYDVYNQTFPNPISLATQIKVAQDFFTDYFVSGKVSKGAEGDYKVAIKVSETETGKVFMESEVEGNDLFGLIDQLTIQLNDQLYLPDAQSNTMQLIDLPVKELITADNDALENYIKGQILFMKNPQIGEPAIQLIKKSIEKDPNCTDCHFVLAQLQFYSNEQEASLQNIEKASLLAESQPERKKMAIRAFQLQRSQKISQMMQLYENWRKLYPNDLTPYTALMQFYSLLQQFDKAKTIGLAALENGHRGNFMTQLANVYIHTEEYDKAEKLLKEFAVLYPHKANKTYELADIYIAQGKLQEAYDFYENLVVMKGDDVRAIIGLSSTQDKLGQFDQAEKTLTDFLTKARLPQDSMEVYRQLETHFVRLGKYQPFAKSFDQHLAINSRIAPPITRLNIIFSNLSRLVSFQKTSIAKQYMSDLANQMTNFKEIINCIGSFFIAYQTKDIETFNQVVNNGVCRPTMINNFGTENGEDIFEGYIASANGDYAKAIQNFESYFEKQGVSMEAYEKEMLELYRKNKDFDKANALLEKTFITDPNAPAILFIDAKLKFDQGDKEGASERLNKALNIWSEADDTYQNYLEAKTFGKEQLGLEL